MGAGVLTAESPPFPRDAGMTELIRPSHYGGVQSVLPVRKNRRDPAEVLVHGGRVTLARRRERYADLIRGETDD